MPHFKGRHLFLFSTAGMVATFAVWTALTAQYLDTGKKSFGIGVVGVIFVYNTFYSLAWLPLVVTYPFETATTKQRGIIFSWTRFSINASSFLVNYINPIGLGNLGWRYYIIPCLFDCLLLVIVYCTFVETQRLTLEEVAVVFDCEQTFDDAAAVVGAEMVKSESTVESERVRPKA